MTDYSTPYADQAWTDASISGHFVISQNTPGDIAASATIVPTTETPGAHPLDAAHLNHMEAGIKRAQETANAAGQDAAGAITLSQIYRVGDVHISTIATNPSAYYGGTWVAMGQGRVLVGAGTSDAAYTAGATGGESNHTLSSTEIPGHTHTGPDHTHSIAQHTHTIAQHLHTIAGHIHSIAAHIHGGGFATNGGTAGGGTGGTAASTDSGGAGNTDSGGAGNTGNGGPTGTGNGGPTVTGSGGTGATGSTGGGAAHNNMPPYLVVYMWLRTA